MVLNFTTVPMFNSILSSGWFRKTSPKAGPTNNVINDEPLSFVLPGRDSSHLYQVSMKEDTEEFVDIDYKKLSYAEVALMSKNKQQTSKVPMASPKENRVNSNQYEILATEDADLTESMYMTPERFKTNNYFFKNKVYKDADRTRKMRRKPKK